MSGTCGGSDRAVFMRLKKTTVAPALRTGPRFILFDRKARKKRMIGAMRVEEEEYAVYASLESLFLTLPLRDSSLNTP